MWRRLLRDLLNELLSLTGGGPIGAFGQPTGASVCGWGNVSAPAAAGTIVQIVSASLPAGLYHVGWYAAFGATPGLDFDFQARVAAVTQFAFGPPAVANTPGYTYVESVHLLDGTGSLILRAQTGGVVGSIYKGVIIATPIRS